jgi:hypothetical protein
VITAPETPVVQVPREAGGPLVQFPVGEHGPGVGHDHRGPARILRGVRPWVHAVSFAAGTAS